MRHPRRAHRGRSSDSRLLHRRPDMPQRETTREWAKWLDWQEIRGLTAKKTGPIDRRRHARVRFFFQKPGSKPVYDLRCTRFASSVTG
jgi:hypothetical protein